MSFAVRLLIVYGAFCEVGGAIGFIKAKSIASLIAGGISGLVLIACAGLLHQGNRLGAIGGLAVAVLLGGRFLMAWLRSKKLMPDLVMVLFSAATIAVLLPFCYQIPIGLPEAQSEIQVAY